VEPDPLIPAPEEESANRQGWPAPAPVGGVVAVTSSAVPVAVIVWVVLDENSGAEKYDGTVFCTVTDIMVSDEFANPPQYMTCAVIRLSTPVTVQRVVHGVLHVPVQVSAVVPVPPFNWAMRAAKVAAVCALFVLWKFAAPAIAARSADRCRDT
jgi:hypothetical protein